MITKESQNWINHWLDMKAKYERLNKPLDELKQRIIRHKASQTLGREFGESPEEYFKRKGLTDYHNWSPEF